VKLLPTAVALTAAGLGVSILPASVGVLVRPGITVLSLRHHLVVVKTALVRRRDDAPTPAQQHFLRLALATLEPDRLGPEVARRPRPRE
jgi:DNA-binding transcriptional LysR family regulator